MSIRKSMRYSAAYAVVFIRLGPVPRVAISSSIKSIARKCSYIEMGSIVDSTSAAGLLLLQLSGKKQSQQRERQEKLPNGRSAGHRAGTYSA